MSQETNFAFCSEIVLNPNKIFTFKGENYNVDFDLIKRNCKYFADHSSEFESKEKIEINEPIDIPNKTFQTFLNCCQNQLSYIDDILGINYLSAKYQNEKLLKFTEDCIEKNYSKLIFQSISLKQQIQQSAKYSLNNSESKIDTSNEEKILSLHFMEYLEDERIFTLPITVLDRVMKNFFNEKKEILEEENTKKKINNFLLRCLKEYKKPASILFLNINFDKLDRDIIISLHNDYDQIFDFNMLNVKSLFNTTYDLIGENTKMMALIKDISDRQASEMNEYKLNFEKQLKEIRDEQKKLNEWKLIADQNQTQFSEKIQVLENKDNEINSILNNIDEKQNNFSGRIQTLENKNNEIDSKLRNLDEKQNNSSGKVQTIENRFHNIEEKQNNFSGRIQTLENNHRTTESQISQQRQNQQTMQSTINGISQSISKFATREISFII